MRWLSSKDTFLSSSVLNSFTFGEYKTISSSVRNKTIKLSDNSKTILEKRYLRKDENGNIVETIEQMFERVARVVAEPDAPYRDVKRTEVEFYNLLSTKRFFPNSPTFTGAGTPLGQLAACFVLPVTDDLGKDPAGIFSTLRSAALIQQVGGGNGFSFSDLRSKGSIVKTSGGAATGPIGFLSVYDKAFGEIAQGGIRRGANMGVLRVDHPDIREFITCKAEEGRVANFNISVAITNAFMEAVKNDTTYDLVDPSTKKVIESPRAREIFDMIVEHAYKNGEPGVLFIDEANRTNPVPHLYELKATNPCGEQWLGPYENCALGSINLNEHLNEDGSLSWEALRETIELSTRFLDNVVTANKYVPAVPQLKIAAEKVRRIGLGFMGLADVMYSAGIRYGSPEGQEFAAQVTEFMRYHSMLTSIELAKERGPFLGISGSVYDPQNLTWNPPKPLKPFNLNFGRPEIDWNIVMKGLSNYGIRNGAQTTVAPTGTISTVAGVEGYGCEPVFALAYMRNVYQSAGDSGKLTLHYVSPSFDRALQSLNLDEETRKRIIDRIIEAGTCQNIPELPENVRNVFVVSSDITAEEHIRMQASIQAFIDNSISKTCNFPESATREDVAKAFMLGWELKCKGLTVYVTGTRQEVVLETNATKNKKSFDVVTNDIVNTSLSSPNHAQVANRGYKLAGNTYKVHTPQGKAFITVNRDENGYPFEVFVSVGKAGSDLTALSEALGRLLSGWLRASHDPTSTVKEIVSQLKGIGGSRSVGFGPNRVSSVPDAVAQVLADEFNLIVTANGYTDMSEHNSVDAAFVSDSPATSDTSANPSPQADICPECGNHSLVLEEGCAKCYNCSYSRC